ncbi:MAG: hypothetical protein KI790_06230 [Cyclobacteriaceae bacterium]|nr:hypothetical protein [Cyclobacteriaceae bacterium HetDA_MAG_MS6]
MSTSDKIFALFYGTSLYFWLAKLYRFHFEFVAADQIALLLSLLVPFVVIRRVDLAARVSPAALTIATVILVLVPLTSFTMITYAMQYIRYAWVLLYILIGIGGLLLAMGRFNWMHFAAMIAVIVVWILPYSFPTQQKLYQDKIVASLETRKGSTQIVNWRNDYWVYYNGKLLSATVDQHMTSEALMQPAMHLLRDIKHVLILGGDDGGVMRELSKLENMPKVDQLPVDHDLFDFLEAHSKWLGPSHKRFVQLIDSPSALFQKGIQYDLIIVDVPTNQTQYAPFFTSSFYQECLAKLLPDGLLVTVSGNPYLQPQTFKTIAANLQNAGMNILDYHAQIPSLGQSSWIIGSRRHAEAMRNQLLEVSPKLPAKWWSQEAMKMMLSSGKREYFQSHQGQLLLSESFPNP